MHLTRRAAALLAGALGTSWASLAKALPAAPMQLAPSAEVSGEPATFRVYSPLDADLCWPNQLVQAIAQACRMEQVTGGGMWVGKCGAKCTAAFAVAFHRASQTGKQVTLHALVSALDMDTIAQAAADPSLPKRMRLMNRASLEAVPGYVHGLAASKQHQWTQDHHNYAVGLISDALALIPAGHPALEGVDTSTVSGPALVPHTGQPYRNAETLDAWRQRMPELLARAENRRNWT